jgi:hypothetical protein
MKRINRHSSRTSVLRFDLIASINYDGVEGGGEREGRERQTFPVIVNSPDK